MSKIIISKQGHEIVVDDEDYELLKDRRWGSTSLSSMHRTQYAYELPSYKGNQMHRIIMNCPEGMVVDHIDHNGLNNQKSNLRICTLKDNARNSRTSINKKTSKYKGVCETSNYMWSAYIGNIKIGTYNYESDAARAYNRKAKELYGEFAYLNVIEDVPKTRRSRKKVYKEPVSYPAHPDYTIV